MDTPPLGQAPKTSSISPVIAGAVVAVIISGVAVYAISRNAAPDATPQKVATVSSTPAPDTTANPTTIKAAANVDLAASALLKEALDANSLTDPSDPNFDESSKASAADTVLNTQK